MIETYLGDFRSRKAARDISGENVLYVVNTSDPDAESMLAAYRTRRSIPDENIIRYPLTWTYASSSAMDDADLRGVFTQICAALDLLKDKIRCICPFGHWPHNAPTAFRQANGFGGNPMSMSPLFEAPYLTNDYRFGLYAVPSLSYNFTDAPIPFEFQDEYLETPVRPDALSDFATQLVGLPEDNYPRWQPNTDYVEGAVVWTDTSKFYAYALTCTTAGHSGPTEPTSYNGSISDGSVVWVGQRPSSPFKGSWAFRLPEDHYTRQRSIGDNGRGAWKHRLRYSVVFLDVPYVGENDPLYGSRLELFTSLLDKCLAVEAAEYTSLPGDVVLQGSGSYNTAIVASPAFIELQDRPFDGTIYHQNLDAEQNKLGSVLPTTDVLPGGATTISPKYSGTFVPFDNVFVHALGTDSYFSNAKIFTRDDFTYADGAVTVFSQSCGVQRPHWQSIDTLYEEISLLQARNSNGAELDAKSPAEAGLYFRRDEDKEGSPIRFIGIVYSGMSATATVSVPSDNTIVLREDGVVVATINLNRSAFYDMQDAIRAGVLAVADWSLSFSCSGVESRCSRALRDGACVTVGSPAEPGSANMPSTTNLLAAFYDGATIAHAQLVTLVESDRIGATSGRLVRPIFYGDPLYRPLAGLRR